MASSLGDLRRGLAQWCYVEIALFLSIDGGFFLNLGYGTAPMNSCDRSDYSAVASGPHGCGPEVSVHLALRPFPGPGSRPSSQDSSPGDSCRPHKPHRASPASAAALLHTNNQRLSVGLVLSTLWKAQRLYCASYSVLNMKRHWNTKSAP